VGQLGNKSDVGEKCLGGHWTGLFIGVKAWAAAKQLTDHSLQRNRDLFKELASNRIEFYFCFLRYEGFQGTPSKSIRGTREGKKSMVATGVNRRDQGLPGGCGMARRSAEGNSSADTQWRRGEWEVG
jgi:hypothetical protein